MMQAISEVANFQKLVVRLLAVIAMHVPHFTSDVLLTKLVGICSLLVAEFHCEPVDLASSR